MLQKLCSEINEYKSNQIRKLIAKASENQAVKIILEDILALYSNMIFLSNPIYRHLMELAKSTHDFETISEAQVLNLKNQISALNQTTKKGKELLSITIKEFNTSNLFQDNLMQSENLTVNPLNDLTTNKLLFCFDLIEKWPAPQPMELTEYQKLENGLKTLHQMIQAVQSDYIKVLKPSNNQIQTPFDAILQKVSNADKALSPDNDKQQNQKLMAQCLKETVDDIHAIMNESTNQSLRNSTNPIIRFIPYLWDNLTWLQTWFDRPKSTYEKQCYLVVNQISLFQKSKLLSEANEQEAALTNQTVDNSF